VIIDSQVLTTTMAMTIQTPGAVACYLGLSRGCLNANHSARPSPPPPWQVAKALGLLLALVSTVFAFGAVGAMAQIKVCPLRADTPHHNIIAWAGRGDRSR
jgi:hypothetical protein